MRHAAAFLCLLALPGTAWAEAACTPPGWTCAGTAGTKALPSRSPTMPRNVPRA